MHQIRGAADARARSDEAAAAPREDRKTIIARAAVKVLGREGSRGFTHRAIDREMAFPAGTTSAYYRRKADLFLAVFNFVVAEDLAILARHFDAITSAKAPIDVDAVANFVLGFVKTITARNDFTDLARYECYLVARRDPGLAKIIGVTVRKREEYWTAVFASLNAAAPARSAAVFDILLRGIFYRHSLLSNMVETSVPTIDLVRGIIMLALSER